MYIHYWRSSFFGKYYHFMLRLTTELTFGVFSKHSFRRFFTRTSSMIFFYPCRSLNKNKSEYFRICNHKIFRTFSIHISLIGQNSTGHTVKYPDLLYPGSFASQTLYIPDFLLPDISHKVISWRDILRLDLP